MNTETIVKLANLVTEKKHYNPIMASVAINGHVVATDFETTIKLPLGSFEGLSGCYVLGKNAVDKKGCEFIGDIPAAKIADLDNYPSYPTASDTQQITEIDAQALRLALESVMPAICLDEYRYNICGVYFNVNELVATDGHRLHINTSIKDLGIQAIIPIKSVKVLIAAIKATNVHKITLYHGSNGAIIFSFYGIPLDIAVRPIDAKYPDYKAISGVFLNCSMQIKLDYKTLSKALKGLPTNKATLTISSQDGLTAKIVYRLEQATRSLDAPCNGVSRVTLDATYLLDALKILPSTGTIEICDGLSPVNISDGHIRAIVMPMKSK